MSVSATDTFPVTGEAVGAGGVGVGIFGAGVVTLAGVVGALAATDGQR
ncbi:MAG: hypothetical protein ABI994_01720 [Gemmatimonadales bacterium]